MTPELEQMEARALAKARADHLVAGHQTPKCKICRTLLPTRCAIAAAWLEGRSFDSIAREYCVSVPTLRKHLLECELPNLKLSQRHSALDWRGILNDMIAAQNDLREMAQAQASLGQAEAALAAIRQMLAIFDRRLMLARMRAHFTGRCATHVRPVLRITEKLGNSRLVCLNVFRKRFLDGRSRAFGHAQKGNSFDS